MRSGLRLFGLVLVGAALVGCGGGEEMEGGDDVPEWYLNTPEDPNYVYAANTATSQRMQVAIDKATTGPAVIPPSARGTRMRALRRTSRRRFAAGCASSTREARRRITAT